ncbi:MAG: type II toxin-antitoxin system HicB family antitoxin [Candidatus Hydrogenedentes bacterium]|nr:type II toxin-antitoxin system HicB family antitoxin [Candidatus Hydrogenedentota bacterium]
MIEKDANSYYAYCSELPGCQTQGDTLDEVVGNLGEAVKLYLSALDYPSPGQLPARLSFSSVAIRDKSA